jgi:hypothetical protein
VRAQLGLAPANPTDEVTKAYVDGLIAGVGGGGGGGGGGGAAEVYTEVIGNGSSTTFTITHSIGTRGVLIGVYDTSTFEEIHCDKFRPTTNTVSLVFAAAPTTNQYSVVVMGGSASGAGVTRSVVSVLAPTTLSGTSGTDVVAMIGASGVATLPTASANTNQYTLKNTQTTLSTTVLTTGGQLIEGSSSITLVAGQSVDLISDGTNWRVV